VHAREWIGRRGLSRPPPEMTVRRELGGRLWARWWREDRVGSDASQDDMGLPSDPFRAIAEGCAPIVTRKPQPSTRIG